MKSQMFKFAAVVMLAAGAVSAVAQQQAEPRYYREANAWVQEVSGTLPATRALRVDMSVGSIHLDGADQPNIAYTIKMKVYTGDEETARRQLESLRPTARVSGDTAVIANESGAARRLSGEVWIKAPRSLQMARVSTHGGAIGVNNINGSLLAETNGGSIALAGIGGPADANTMGGDITVESANADLRLHTNGGGIRVNTVNARLVAGTLGGDLQIGTVHGPAALETSGGSIRVTKTDGDLRAETAGGNIDAGDIGGTAILETAGGSIRLSSARGTVHAETAGGSIHLGRVSGGIHAETAAGGITAEFVNKVADSTLETSVGDITVYLPSNLACSIRAAIEMAAGHRIRSDFPELKITTTGDYGPQEQRASGSLNGGGPTLRLQTNMGDIQILRTAAH